MLTTCWLAAAAHTAALPAAAGPWLLLLLLALLLAVLLTVPLPLLAAQAVVWSFSSHQVLHYHRPSQPLLQGRSWSTAPASSLPLSTVLCSCCPWQWG